jgi:hypothetical protein
MTARDRRRTMARLNRLAFEIQRARDAMYGICLCGIGGETVCRALYNEAMRLHRVACEIERLVADATAMRRLSPYE